RWLQELTATPDRLSAWNCFSRRAGSEMSSLSMNVTTDPDDLVMPKFLQKYVPLFSPKQYSLILPSCLWSASTRARVESELQSSTTTSSRLRQLCSSIERIAAST